MLHVGFSCAWHAQGFLFVVAVVEGQAGLWREGGRVCVCVCVYGWVGREWRRDMEMGNGQGAEGRPLTFFAIPLFGFPFSVMAPTGAMMCHVFMSGSFGQLSSASP